MADDLDAIVTTPIDGLVKIKQEETELERLVEKATARKDQVPEAVFQRVVGDYTTRIAALEAEARPLRQQARAEFVKLGAVHRQARETLDKAEFDRQEIEFRHDVGEFGDEEFEQRIGAARANVAACQEAFDRTEALRQRFLDVLPADANAAEPTVPSAPEPSAPEPSAPEPSAPEPSAPEPPAVDEPAGDTPEPAGTVEPGAGPPPVEEAAAPSASPEGTVVGLTPAPPPPTSELDDSRAHPAPDAESFATVAIAPAVLAEEGGQTYKLGALTSIGRTANNTIVVPVREVSRHHAQILLTETGYVLKDLESGNGTFVNGNRVREWRLQESDRVQVADRVFVFKSR